MYHVVATNKMTGNDHYIKLKWDNTYSMGAAHGGRITPHHIEDVQPIEGVQALDLLDRLHERFKDDSSWARHFRIVPAGE